MEAEFREKLIAALRRCQKGQWGLFGQNDHLDMPERLKQEAYIGSGAAELDALGQEIEQTRIALGMPQTFALYAKFLSSRGRKTENDLGEPRLAEVWLHELES